MLNLLLPKALFKEHETELLSYALCKYEGCGPMLSWVETMHAHGYPKRDLYYALLELHKFIQEDDRTKDNEEIYDAVSDFLDGFTDWGGNRILPDEPAVLSLRKTIFINAPVTIVWNTLTNPSEMKKWIYETEVDIVSTFEKGSTFIICGDLHGIPFENKGIVWEFEPEKRFIYSYLSSLSGPGRDESDAIMVHFTLEPQGDYTLLGVIIDSIITEVDFKHLQLYWSVTLDIFKKQVETNA